jgi:hypothetical protein
MSDEKPEVRNFLLAVNWTLYLLASGLAAAVCGYILYQRPAIAAAMESAAVEQTWVTWLLFAADDYALIIAAVSLWVVLSVKAVLIPTQPLKLIVNAVGFLLPLAALIAFFELILKVMLPLEPIWTKLGGV